MSEYPVWFHDSNFGTYLNDFKNRPSLKFLQIGVYTGDATRWLLDNVLTDPTSIIVDVDTWEGSDEPAHKSLNFNDVFQYYKERFSSDISSGKVICNKTTSDKFFLNNSNKFDFIYIDGDHHAMQTYADAVNSWQCLNTNGILAFDDYTWAIDDNPLNSPRYGIDKFLVEYDGEYKVLVVNTQVWIQKI